MKQMKWGFFAGLLGLLVVYGLNGPAEDQTQKTTKAAVESPSLRQPASSSSKTQVNETAKTESTAVSARTGEMQNIRRLQECLETENCDYPQTDPQSYALGVGQDLRSSLKALAKRLKDDPSLSAEAEKLARELMKNPDGHIQEGALEIFAELSPSAENLVAIVEGLQANSADPLIFEQASAELSRYLGSSNEPQVHQFFAKTLMDGALFTSQKAGTLVRRFLTPQSVSYYREVLKRLPADSTKARHLRGTLEEFERRSQGG